MVRLDADELPIDTEALARTLIGYVLVRDSEQGRAAGRIIETEAYLLGDPASHAFIGPRPRTVTMFADPFHAYVYQIYGANFCVNVSSEPRGSGAAVLVRALEPLEGVALMQLRRGTTALKALCRGPGRLCHALGIDRSLDGRCLVTDAELWLAKPHCPAGAIGSSRRIGISRAAQRRLRFYERDNPFVSGPRSLSP